MRLHMSDVKGTFLMILAIVAVSEFCSVITVAQSINPRSAGSIVPLSTTSDRVGIELVFESETITVRHITVKPESSGYHYRHPGGSIILLSEYSFKIPMPLSGELDAKLRVGDVIQVEAGDYVLENHTSRPLDFLSVEKKK